MAANSVPRVESTFRELIPPLRTEERAALEASILKEGCREPLVVWRETGVIVDGHNRYEICSEHGVTIETREMHFEDEAAAKAWMIDNQLGRRNLSEVDRIELHLAREDLRALRRPGRPKRSSLRSTKQTPHGVNIDEDSAQLASLNHHERSTDERVGKASGTSREKVRKHRRIKAQAPGLLDAIRDGKETYNGADRQVTRLLEKEAKEKRRLEAAHKVEQLAFDERLMLRHGDFTDALADLPDASVDLIVTDPPWSLEYLELWDRLGEVAFRLLKEGAFLIAYTGNEKVFDKHKRLEAAGLSEYCLIYSYQLKRPWLGKRQACMKPILALSKGTPREHEMFFDLVPTKGFEASAKEYHPWGQPLEESRYLVRKFSEPSELVVDPMAGSATTLIASVLEGRRALGCEIDKEHYLEAKRKIVELLPDLR